MTLFRWLKSIRQNVFAKSLRSHNRKRSGSNRTLTVSVMEYLEQRVLLAAAYSAENPEELLQLSQGLTGEDSHRQLQSLFSTMTTQFGPGESANAPGAAPRIISFVDPGLENYRQLMSEVAAGNLSVAGADGLNDVYLLDPSRDGIQQMTERLSGRSGISAIRIFSHGSSGALLLGAGRLDSAGLNLQRDAFGTWRRSLTSDADILLYGCSVAQGQQGERFAQDLAALTGADIAASTNLTGGAAQGGDWDLEYSTGPIEKNAAFASSSYQGLLRSYGKNDFDQTFNDTSANGIISLAGVGESLEIRIEEYTEAVTVYAEKQIKSKYKITAWGSWGATPEETHTLVIIAFEPKGKIELIVGSAGKTSNLWILDKTTFPKITLTRNATVEITFSGTGYLDHLSAAEDFSGTVTLGYQSTSETSEVLAITPATSKVPRIGQIDESASNFYRIATNNARQQISINQPSSDSTLYVWSGTADDNFDIYEGKQVLAGGAGNDKYEFNDNWGIDEVNEDAGGGSDTLDFKGVSTSTPLNIDIYPSEVVGSEARHGVYVEQTTPSGVPNKIESAKYIERVIGSTAQDAFKFYDNWAYQGVALTKKKIYINSAPENGTSTAPGDVLNFGEVDQDLTFILRGNGSVDVISTPTINGKIYTFSVVAHGIHQIVGGRKTNTYQILKEDSLQGGITSPSGARNVLDYSFYKGTVRGAAMVENRTSQSQGYAASGLKYQQNAANQVQKLSIGAAVSGSFKLKFDSFSTLETDSIDIAKISGTSDVDYAAMKTSIQAALEKKFPKMFEVEVAKTGATDDGWNITFQSFVSNTGLAVSTSSLLDQSNASVTPTFSNVQQMVSPFGASGIDSVASVQTGDSVKKPVTLFTSGVANVGSSGVTGGLQTISFGSVNGPKAQTGSTSNDAFSGGAGSDLLDGRGGNDVLAGNEGADTLTGGAGDDQLYGGSDPDILKGSTGDDMLSGDAGDDLLDGGAGDDTYLFGDGWGIDTLYEADAHGADTLDFSATTTPATFVLSNGELMVGTSTFSPSPGTSYWQSEGFTDLTGSFSGGNQLSIVKTGSFNEIQGLFLAGAKGGTFRLNFSVGGQPNRETITIGSNDADTAANIETKINRILNPQSGDKTGEVKVTAPSRSVFRIEFLTPRATDIAEMTIDQAALQQLQPDLGTNVVSGGDNTKNTVWKFDIGMASGGGFALTFKKGGVSYNPAQIVVDPDPAVTATNIKTALAGVLAEVTVTPTGFGAFSVEFVDSKIVAVTDFLLSSTSTLNYQTGVFTLQDGQSGAEIQEVKLTRTSNPASPFALKIGSVVTGNIVWDNDPTVTAANIKTAINAQRQSTWNPYKFDVDVSGTGTVAEQTFRITFNAPKDTDVSTIELVPTVALTAAVTTIYDGISGGGLKNIETIIAPNADSTFKFGNEVINDVWAVARQALIPGDFRNYGELNIDASTLSENGHKLVLDFSKVARPLSFSFESEGNEIQELKLNDQNTFKLSYNGVETGDITVYSISHATALSIETQLNLALIQFNLTVSVNPEDGVDNTFTISFNTYSDVQEIQVVGSAADKPTVTVVEEGNEVRTLTVEKIYNLPELFTSSYSAELWSAYWGEIVYDTIVITNVDENTTVIGGRDDNTFSIAGSATFPGKIQGLNSLLKNLHS